MYRQTPEESSKLTAAFLNGLALAVLVATVITPAVQWLGSTGLFATSILGGLVALALHIIARTLVASRSGALGRERCDIVATNTSFSLFGDD